MFLTAKNVLILNFVMDNLYLLRRGEKMRTLNISIDEETYRKLKIFSREKKMSEEEIAKILIKEKLEEELLKKAEEIIKKEKNLLKRLA